METSGYFPGFFDSDGRPWNRGSGSFTNYREGLETALKIALLTERHLLLPEGYILDNPFLLRIFGNYGNDSPRAKAFRLLMSDLIRITTSRDLGDGDGRLSNWEGALEQWVAGGSSKRGVAVYCNSVGHETAQQLQNEDDPKKFIGGLKSAIKAQWDIDLEDSLKCCNALKFEISPRDSFSFGDVIRTRLMRKCEKFPELDSRLLEKMQAADEALAKAGKRLSRSALNSPELCRSHGVSEQMILTAEEYVILSPVLGHYHHLAFAKSLNQQGFISWTMPKLPALAKTVLKQQIMKFSSSIRTSKNEMIDWPVKDLTWEVIHRLRLGQGASEFLGSLDDVHDARRHGDAAQVQEAIRKHSRCIRKWVGWRSAGAPKLAGQADNTYQSSSQLVSVTRTVFQFFSGFRHYLDPVVRGHQVRLFFRRVEEQLDGLESGETE